MTTENQARETRGTAPANLQNLVKNFVLKNLIFPYNCQADFDSKLANWMKILTEFAETYAAERVSQPVAPPPVSRIERITHGIQPVRLGIFIKSECVTDFPEDEQIQAEMFRDNLNRILREAQ